MWKGDGKGGEVGIVATGLHSRRLRPGCLVWGPQNIFQGEEQNYLCITVPEIEWLSFHHALAADRTPELEEY